MGVVAIPEQHTSLDAQCGLEPFAQCSADIGTQLVQQRCWLSLFDGTKVLSLKVAFRGLGFRAVLLFCLWRLMLD